MLRCSRCCVVGVFQVLRSRSVPGVELKWCSWCFDPRFIFRLFLLHSTFILNAASYIFFFIVFQTVYTRCSFPDFFSIPVVMFWVLSLRPRLQSRGTYWFAPVRLSFRASRPFVHDILRLVDCMWNRLVPQILHVNYYNCLRFRVR